MKKCSRCKEEKPFNKFYKEPRNRDGLRGVCKDCDNKQSMAWGKAHPERAAFFTRRSREKLRILLFHHYTNVIEDSGTEKYQCSCCHRYLPAEFMTIDHINSDGADQRRARWGYGKGGSITTLVGPKNIKTGVFPPDLQILCWDCNCVKGSRGQCSCNHGQVFRDAIQQT